MSFVNGFLGDVNTPTSNAFIEGLLGELAAMDNSNPDKAKAIVKIKNKMTTKGVVATNTLSAKAEFESRLHLLPASVIADLQNGRLQIVDKVIYTNKAIGVASYAELMSNADVASAGVCNINNRKLEANQYFMLTEVILMSAVNATLAASAFGIAVANILNGEFQLTIGSKIIVPKTSCQIFNTTNRVNGFLGAYKLANPKLIAPQTEIKPELWSAAANAANTNVAILFVGAILEKN